MIAKVLELMEIREMRKEDLFQVDVIEKNSYDFPWSDKVLEECLEYNYDCYVSAHENLIFGYLISKISFPESHILNLTVDSNYRNNGIGSQLLDLTLSKSVLIGSKVIFLETRKTNNSAIYLYNKYEFKKVGIRPNYYKTKDGKEDAVVYCKKLDFSRA